VYGEVGVEANAEEIVQMIDSFPKEKPILVRINSFGGFVHDGLAIYAALKQRGNVITRVDGIAASAASVIAMAGSPVQVFPHSQLFLHRAIIGVVGNSKALRYAIDWLEKIDHSIATIYSQKTGKSLKRIEEYLDGEYDGTIFTADESMKIGLADVMLANEESEEPEEPEQVAVPKNFIPDNPPGGEGEAIEGDWENPSLEDFTDKAWEELTEEERQEIAKYFGFVETLESYEGLKLPHHFPPNHEYAGKASLEGVETALNSLADDSSIPEEDRSLIEEHLKEHLPEDVEETETEEEPEEAKVKDELDEVLALLLEV